MLLMGAQCPPGGSAGRCLRPMAWIVKIYQKPLEETRLLPVALLFIACGFISTSRSQRFLRRRQP